MENRNFGTVTGTALMFAPKVITDGEKSIITSDPAVYAAYGYLSVTETPQPEAEGYYYERAGYEVIDGVIVPIWEAHEIVEPEESDEATAEDYQAALDEIAAAGGVE